MELIMISKSNEYCWLYSTIYLNNEYLCDTLEFGSEKALESGTYKLNLGKDKLTNEPLIIVSDFMENIVSNIVKKNVFTYKNIMLRKENSNICIGCKSSEPLLHSYNYAMRLLLMKISGCKNMGEPTLLIIERKEKI